MRTGAINDKHRLRRIRFQIPLDNPGMRKIHGTRNMTPPIRFRTPHIQHNKPSITTLERGVNIPTIRLKCQQSLKMRQRGFRIGGRYLGNR